MRRDFNTVLRAEIRKMLSNVKDLANSSDAYKNLILEMKVIS